MFVVCIPEICLLSGFVCLVVCCCSTCFWVVFGVLGLSWIFGWFFGDAVLFLSD